MNGPIMFGIGATALAEHERAWLRHPACAGVILFARNYENAAQLRELCREIRHLAPHALIAVDHEGGRVQRFSSPDFTPLPAAARYADLFHDAPLLAFQCVRTAAFVMAYELRSCGLDFSFAPVLDLAAAPSTVIGDRAISAEATLVAEYGAAFCQGVHALGMCAVGKHFPGHGSISADSHHVLPQDPRPFTELMRDLYPFMRLVHQGIDAIMSAHIIYPALDAANIATFSKTWLQGILREELAFQGCIISDDLDMQAALSSGSVEENVVAALTAGCDLLLVCRRPEAITEALDCAQKLPYDQRSLLRRQALAQRNTPLPELKLYEQARCFLAKHIPTPH